MFWFETSERCQPFARLTWHQSHWLVMPSPKAGSASGPAASQGSEGPGRASRSSFEITTFNVGSDEDLRDPKKVNKFKQKLHGNVRDLLRKSHVVCLNEVSPRWYRFLDETLSSTTTLVYQAESLTLIIYHTDSFVPRPVASRDAANRCFPDLQTWDVHRSWRVWQQVIPV